MKTILFISHLLLFAWIGNAQICKGKVVDAKTNDPILFASIFLEGSTIGTISDSTGCFILDTHGHASIPLIVSCIGYQNRRLINNYISDSLIIVLAPKEVEINEVEVTANYSERKKHIKTFEKEFLGTTENGKKCEIINKEVLIPEYDKKSKTLTISASGPIEIINPNLGYKIIYLLSSFKKNREGINYSGYSMFINLDPENEKEKEKIEKNRWNAYVYSRMHFIRCLYSGPLSYTCFKLADNLRNVVHTSDIVYESENGTREICFDKVLTLYYQANGRTPYMGYSTEEGKWVWSYDVIGDSEEAKFSFFILNSECVTIENFGYYNPDEITWFGDLSYYRVGDLLPYNYHVTVK